MPKQERAKKDVAIMIHTEECKPKTKKEDFYDELETIVEKEPKKNEKWILMGDFKARIWEVIPWIKQRRH